MKRRAVFNFMAKVQIRMIEPRRFMAKDLSGKWVTGWYAELHISQTDAHDMLLGHKVVPCLFNDEPGERSKGSYWHEIRPETLQEVVEVKQLTLF